MMSQLSKRHAIGFGCALASNLDTSALLQNYEHIAQAHQAIEPRVGRVQMGAHELEPQQTAECEDASHGRLRRARRRDENEHSRQ